jgi:transglutaminase-like putative cysteine protease
MRIRAGFEITYECPAPTPMWLALSVHPSRRDDLETPDQLRADPRPPISQYRDGFGNLCTRLVAPAGRITLSSDFVIQDSGLPDAAGLGAPETPLDQLPPETLVYLLGSRYCETDRLSDLAWRLFGGTTPGERRVEAVIDYVHRHIAFDYNQARPTRTAYEAFEERCGVCRDYAHLAIAFCRCLNLPARYCTGYLGDIGVEPLPYPGDFSAWFEVYLDGRWRAFDARHAEPRIGRILVAHGRDATDTAISTAFGPNRLVRFNVFTDELVEREARLATASWAR